MTRHGVCEDSSGLCKSFNGTSVLEEIPLQIQDVSDAPQLAGSDPKPAKPSKPAAAPAKILFLDGVRGLAAILVVSQHSREYLHDLDLGACAVDAFFVLSSFLLTMIFMKKSMRMLAQNASYRKWAFSLADYLCKRFFRVYPLFAAVVGVLWLLPFADKERYFLVQERGHFDVLKVLTFSFQHRYFVFWTLPLEISYYFCLPVFVLGMLNLRRFWWVPFVPLYTWVIYAGWHERRSSHSPLMPHFPTFLAGSMAAALFVKLDVWMKATGFAFNTLHKLAIRAVEYAAIALILSVCFRRNAPPGQPAEPTMFFHWVHEHDDGGFPFVSVPVTLVIVVEMLLPSCISTMFEWSVLRYWGKISFSVYLLHSFVVFSDIYGSEPSMYYERFFLRLGLILGLCTASYHLIEYPSQLLAQRITKALTEQEAKGPGRLAFPFPMDAKRRFFRAPHSTQIA
jgi:peptidoglycan/LPS O-acetylase OafA/YrhL